VVVQVSWWGLALGLWVMLPGFAPGFAPGVANAQQASTGPAIAAVLDRLSRDLGQNTQVAVSDGRQAIDRIAAQTSGAAAQAPANPAGLLANAPMVLLARPTLLLSEARDLTVWIKSVATTIRFGHSGGWSASHECALQVRRLTGVQATLVPSANAERALASLKAGDIDLLCESAPAALPHIMAGDVTAVALASDERLPSLWDVPTADEVGLPLFSATAWLGLYTPAGTPGPSTDAVHRALQKVLADDAVLVMLSESGWTPFALPFRSRQAHAAFLSGEVERIQSTFTANGVAQPTQP
jgi:tripartite-type tricarboxylate transporter receptor subunit TctC